MRSASGTWKGRSLPLAVVLMSLCGGPSPAAATKSVGPTTALAGFTYLAGGSTVVTDVAVGRDGSVYVLGYATRDLPTTPGVYLEALDAGEPSGTFVQKLAPDTRTVVYSTFLGGSTIDFPTAIAVGDDGSAYVAGYTQSPSFPTTPGAFQPSLVGTYDDTFVLRLSPDARTLVYSTLLGGTWHDDPVDIALDREGRAYVFGTTFSQDFPSTLPGPAPSQTRSVGYVAALAPDGRSLYFSVNVGPCESELAGGIALDDDENVYVTGTIRGGRLETTPGALSPDPPGDVSAFVVKLAAGGAKRVYATYLGGSHGEIGGRIAVDREGSAYVTGATYSADFPTTPGAFVATRHANDEHTRTFVAKLAADGSALVYSTFLWRVFTVAAPPPILVDDAGVAVVAGTTSFPDLEETAGSAQRAFGGYSDAYVIGLDPDGTGLRYSTYVGASALDSVVGLGMDDAGDVVAAGYTATIENASIDRYRTFVARLTTSSQEHRIAITRVERDRAAPDAYRLRLTGRGFGPGAEVFVGSDVAPWRRATRIDANTIVLEGGAALRARFTREYVTPIRVVNSGGAEAVILFAR